MTTLDGRGALSGRGQRMPRLGQNLQALEEWLDTAEESNLLCRDLGHAWQPARVERAGHLWERTMACGRCASLKRQTITGGGMLLGAKYTYAEDYPVPGLGFLDRYDRGKLRRQLLEREEGGA